MTKTLKTAPPASARLFEDAGPSHASAGVYLANIDGASRGNPGPASYAVVIRDPNGKIVLELGKRIGRTTNNVAEYYALLAALDYASNEKLNALRIQSDSELLVRQMQGRYKVKSPELKPLFERAAKMARQIPYFKIEHVRRELNRDADALANVALDSGDLATKAESLQTTSIPALPALAPSHPAEIVRPSSGASERRATFPMRIRARFIRGVLIPSETLNLPDGLEVIAEIRRDGDA